jgi:hypothetical protein
MAKKILDEMNKEELLEEVARRNKAGSSLRVDGNTTKPDILDALKTEDAAKEKEKSNPLPEGDKSGLPAGSSTAELAAQAPTADKFKNAKRFIQRSSGEAFALVVHDPDTYGRTHTLMNQAHTWQGTEGEFIMEFEKK